MKQRIIVGLLTIFVLAPVVEVFSASMDPGFFLTPEQQEELGVSQQGPSTVAEFPLAPNNTQLGLTFRLWITIRSNTEVAVTFITTPSGQSTVSLGYVFPAFSITALSPQQIACPPEGICQVRAVAAGTTVPFAAVLEILMGNTSVDFLHPQFFFTTQGG